MKKRILLVDDDPGVRASLKVVLEPQYETVAAGSVREGLEAFRRESPHLVLLDIMMPGEDGLQFLDAIRPEQPGVPVIMLSALNTIKMAVEAMRRGAVDYLTKPFGIRELLARVRALLRRGEASQARAAAGASTGPVTYKHIEVDPARRRVRIGSRDVSLTFNEFELLYVLISNPGIVFSRESLLSKVWKDQTFVTVRSVDTLVKRLRKKIETNPADPDVILTVWGAGYKAADV